MFTEHDEGKGLVKVYWNDIRKRIAKIEPKFTKLVDALNPGKSFPLYLAYYPYGATLADTQTTFLPHENNGYFALNSPNTPKDIVENLAYGENGAPLALILEKNFESFIDSKHELTFIPWRIYKPGEFLSFSRTLIKKTKYVHYTNNILTATSGVRSTFMLPPIECATHHENLQRDFNINVSAPKSLYSHWEVFREIASSPLANCNWRSCILFFSEKWVEKLQHDSAWSSLRLYLQDLAWRRFEYQRNMVYYNIAFAMMQKKCNLKPNPYLVDMVQRLFGIALGEVPGFMPANNEENLPLISLSNAFVESYGLKKYLPTILESAYFDFLKSTDPVYYSFQNSSAFLFSPKSRKSASTLFDLRELSRIIQKFVRELASSAGICADTIMSEMTKNVIFNYFHNEYDKHHIILPSTEIPKLDQRFAQVDSQISKKYAEKFASDARFVRGCVSIQRKY